MLNENQLFSNPRLFLATALEVFLCMMEAKEYRGPASAGLIRECFTWRGGVSCLPANLSQRQLFFACFSASSGGYELSWI